MKSEAIQIIPVTFSMQACLETILHCESLDNNQNVHQKSEDAFSSKRALDSIGTNFKFIQ